MSQAPSKAFVKKSARRSCPTSAPGAGLPAAGRRARGRPRHAGIDLRRRCAAAAMPSACTTAPEVSPPATTSWRTPRSTRPRAMRASACSTSSPACSTPSCCLHRAARRRAPRWRRPAPGPSASCGRAHASASRDHVVARGQRQRIDREGRAALRAISAAPARWSRSSSCPTRSRARPLAGGSVARARRGAGATAMPVLRQADRDARAGGDQRQVASAAPMRIRSASEIASTMAMPTPSARSASKRSRIASAPFATTCVRPTRPTLRRRLRLQHAHQVGVGHRRQRVVAHAAVAEQHVADEQVALEDRALVRPGTPGRRS